MSHIVTLSGFPAAPKPRAGPIAVQKGPFREVVTFWLVQNYAKIFANLGDEKPMRKKRKREKKSKQGIFP